MDKKKSIFLRLLLIVGFLIFFYPNISDYVNSFSQSTGIVSYNKAIGQFDNVEIEKIRQEAIDYNSRIFQEKDALYNPELVSGYNASLNPFNDGMMGSVTIDKIGVNLPIYHGVNEGIIQSGVGHLPGTSVPIGGQSTHSVLSTHSGLPSARLFTDLNKLKEGDEFNLSVLGENMFYEVDQIQTVLPHEVESLQVEEGQDYVTLLTCTPYGINTHRLLVRGKRIAKTETLKKKEIEEKAKKSMMLSILKLIAILGVIFVILASVVRDIYLLKKQPKTSRRYRKRRR
ncbi:class C sortase [Streptococcus suis]|uniref:class C sortase n=1 Tax=Streptococcus suis TaxID=1307 RepID=UPI0007A5AD53|nr:class C sortase [Streptococcus suis]MBO4127644.1 class C sortase [Streptococcus suis]WFA75780.1 class C sortase [Streptococcus suis]